MKVQPSYTYPQLRGSVPSRRPRRRRLVWRLGALAAMIGAGLTVVWALTGGSYYWPGWVWLGLAIPFAAVESILWAVRSRTPTRLAVHLAVAGVAGGICIWVWLMAGLGYPWPLWPLLGLVVSLGAHALIWPPGPGVREKQLEERVGALTSSRRSVLEIQEMELRRVERDLHDGAQARLVSLGINLGLAEQLIEADPAQARSLLADARGSAGAALSDLRDLVRGIHPPVLADRGLEEAIQAVVVTVPIPVEVSMDVTRGTLPDPVESAVYFAVAESIANLVKHSGASKAWIRAQQTTDSLTVIIGDDGCGGADMGRGTGLAGIARRLAAFDGTLSVVSPQGGPTILRMDIPCERSLPKTKPF